MSTPEHGYAGAEPMNALLDISPGLAALAAELIPWLSKVTHTFDGAIASDVDVVQDLSRHVQGMRGKMLRPTVVYLSGRAARPDAPLQHEHVIVAAVVEMVHMATLVHDDVLDDSAQRRSTITVNRLHGNEPAVMLGDYLFASAYALCSSLDTPRAARAVARASRTLCEGELLQLRTRGDWTLSEQTYRDMIDRKTAELIAVAAELGAAASGASEPVVRALELYARLVGQAFQVQDDLLDLAGDAGTLGKPVGQDAANGKLTLPLIHHLRTASGGQRTHTLAILAEVYAAGPTKVDAGAAAALRDACDATGSTDFARQWAQNLVRDASAELDRVPKSSARDALRELAQAAISRRA